MLSALLSYFSTQSELVFCVGRCHVDGLQLLLSVVNGGILTYDMALVYSLASSLTVGRASYILGTKQSALKEFQKSCDIDMKFMKSWQVGGGHDQELSSFHSGTHSVSWFLGGSAPVAMFFHL